MIYKYEIAQLKPKNMMCLKLMNNLIAACFIFKLMTYNHQATLTHLWFCV